MYMNYRGNFRPKRSISRQNQGIPEEKSAIDDDHGDIGGATGDRARNMKK